MGNRLTKYIAFAIFALGLVFLLPQATFALSIDMDGNGVFDGDSEQIGVGALGVDPATGVGISDGQIQRSIDLSRSEIGRLNTELQNPDLTAEERRNKNNYITRFQEDIKVLEREQVLRQGVKDQSITADGADVWRQEGAAAHTKAIKAANGKSDESCGVRFWKPQCLIDGFAFILSLLLWVVTLLMSFAGWVFDMVLDLSVKNFGAAGGIGKASAIISTWGILRNLVNITFIFILIYVAIGTILQLNSGDNKRIIKNVILIALLVNFSLFFSRVIIDASNILGNQFYREVTTQTVQNGGSTEKKEISLANNFASRMGIGGVLSEGPDKKTEGLTLRAVIVRFLGALVLTLVASFVLLAGAVIFIVRAVTLIILMILSPLAFAAYAVPNMGKYWSQWWSKLLSQAFLAPIFLFFIFASFKLLGDPGTHNGILSAIPQGSSGDFQGWVDEALAYSLVIGFMLGSLMAAKKLGATGASFAMKASGAITGGAVLAGGWAARRVGRAGLAGAQLAPTLATLGGSSWGRARGLKNIAGIISDTKAAVKDNAIIKKLTKVGKDKDKLKAITSFAGGAVIGGLVKASDFSAKQAGLPSGFMGNVERPKVDKDEEKLKEIKRDLAILKIEGKSEADIEEAKKKVRKVNTEQIVKIDQDDLERLATLLSDNQVAALERKLDQDKFGKIKLAREKPIRDALGLDEKGARIGAVNETALRGAMDALSPRTFAKLNEDLFKFDELIKHMTGEEAAELKKQGVSSGVIRQVKEKVIVFGRTHSAYKWATSSAGSRIDTSGNPVPDDEEEENENTGTVPTGMGFGS